MLPRSVPEASAAAVLPPLLLLLAVLLAPLPAGAIAASDGGGVVPATHDKLYQELAQGLLEFAPRLAGMPASGGRPVRFFAALTTASGHRGRALLEPGGLEGNLVMLDALKELGVQGVKVAIPYPLLVPGQPLAKEYQNFYARLAREIRKRGLSLYVHMSPGSRNPAFSRFPVDARFGAIDRLARIARLQAETVLDLLKPDILGLVNEPSNAADNADLPDLATSEGMTRFLDTVTRDLGHNGATIAAGLGSWDKPELAAALAASPGVQLLDIHVYAVRNKITDYLVQADEYAQLAKLLGKSAALGEVWLYKASAFVLSTRRSDGPANSQEMFRRDAYGFWSPLDIDFLNLMARMAQGRGLEFVCPSWPQYFFSYLDYESELERMAYPALVRSANAAASAAMRRDHLSMTGKAFRKLVREFGP